LTLSFLRSGHLVSTTQDHALSSMLSYPATSK
jgi:hypothetical protein